MYIGSTATTQASLNGGRHDAGYSAQQEARLNMVNGQLRTNKVQNERVVAAMSSIPRELFLPKNLQGNAYLDEDILLENGRFMLEPMVFARLLEAANILPTNNVLLVGLHTGYEAAVISTLTDNLTVLEPDNTFIETANNAFTKLDQSPKIITQEFLTADISNSFYDVIIFNGAVTQLPPQYTKQLRDNGKLLVIERPNTTINGVAIQYQNTKSVVGHRELFDANCPYIPGLKAADEMFQF